jgi:hypothetical protein
MDKFEKMYQWRKNRYEFKRRLPKKIRNDNAKGIYYNVDVAVRTDNGGLFKIYENAPAILSFIGHEPIAYWRRAIASYQMELPLDKTA